MAEQGKGFAGLLGNVFGTAPPAYMEGLLGQQATEDLRKRSIGTGIANALLGYAAMPKNRNLGLGRILAGAAQAGIGGARGVYDNAKTDYLQGQAIEQAKRKQEQDVAQRAAMEKAIAQYPEYADAIRANPALLSEIVKQQIAPRERKTATIGNQLIDVNTGKPIFTGKAEIKPLPTYDVQQGRTKVTYQVQLDGTVKEIGRGSMDAPKAAPQISYKTETDANGNLIYIPNVPNSPVLDAQGKPTKFSKLADKKAPTEGERKAATLLKRLDFSTQQLKDALNPVYGGEISADKPSWFAESAGAIPFVGDVSKNLINSSARQRVEAAQLDILDAALTLGTGAAYTKEQLEGYRTAYFPQLNDTPETIKDKAARLQNVIEAAKIAAGNAAPKDSGVPQDSGKIINFEDL